MNWTREQIAALENSELDRGIDREAPEDVIVITGSLFLVGEARGLFLRPVPKLY